MPRHTALSVAVPRSRTCRTPTPPGPDEWGAMPAPVAGDLADLFRNAPRGREEAI